MIKCDRCGNDALGPNDGAKQARLCADYDVPLVMVQRNFRRVFGASPLRIIEFADADEVPIHDPDLPTICGRCFQRECKRALDNNTNMTFDEFLDFIRRKTN